MVLKEPSCSLILFSLLSWRMVFTLKKTATAFLKRYQSEKCCSSFDTVATGAGSVIAVAKALTCFWTSGSSVESSPNDGGCTGHSSSGCHRNCVPLTSAVVLSVF